MKVSKNSWNYKLWKAWHSGASEPKNLCRYFWFSVFQWTVGWVIVAVSLAVVAVAVTIAWFFGFRADFTKETMDLFPMYKYDLYNQKMCGRRYLFAPWEVVGASFLLFFGKAIFHTCGALFSEIVTLPAILKGIFYGGLLAAVLVLLVGLFYLFQNELVRNYFRATKEKVCPRIELVD